MITLTNPWKNGYCQDCMHKRGEDLCPLYSKTGYAYCPSITKCDHFESNKTLKKNYE